MNSPKPWVGGKTHMMIALGLLARHPELRQQILPPPLQV